MLSNDREGSDVQVQVESVEESRVVHVAGNLTLTTAADLRAILLECFEQSPKTVLDGAAIADIDLCGLQLMCSAHRTRVLAGAAFEFGGVSERVQEVAVAAGYTARRSVCPYRREGNCLWKWE